jgi:hypothetical protein
VLLVNLQPVLAPPVEVFTWRVAAIVLPSGERTSTSTMGVPGGARAASRPCR